MVYDDTKRDANIPTLRRAGGVDNYGGPLMGNSAIPLAPRTAHRAPRTAHLNESVMLVRDGSEFRDVERIVRQLDNVEAILRVNTALINECLMLARSRAARRAGLPIAGLDPAPSAPALQSAS